MLGHILVVTKRLPIASESAGAARLFGLIGLMLGLGWKVTVASLAPLLQSESTDYQTGQVLLQLGAKLLPQGAPQFLNFLDQQEIKIDVAFLSMYDVATFAIPPIRQKVPDCRIIFDMVDCHGLRLLREASITNNLALQNTAFEIFELETKAAQTSDLTVTITESERSLMAGIAGNVRLAVIPLTYDMPPRSKGSPVGRRGLLFVGNFLHRPNADGIMWFIETVWPQIRTETPEITLTIVGSNMRTEIEVFDRIFDINVLGFVDDLAPLMKRSRMTIAPLRFGAGMKGKVAQSMCSGLPVVTTSIGAEGMNLENGRQVLIADDAKAFADQVIRLNQDDFLWKRLSIEAYNHVNANMSTEVVKQLLDGALRHVASL